MQVLQVCVSKSQNRPRSVSGGPQSSERLLTRSGLARSIYATVIRDALTNRVRCRSGCRTFGTFVRSLPAAMGY